MKNLKKLFISVTVLSLFSHLCGCSKVKNSGIKIPIKVLLLPKFEIGEITGDEIGEAQLFYEAYFKDADQYTIPSASSDKTLYVKDGIAMFIVDMGKANSAINTMAVLNDDRFDFSDVYVISIGCAGGARDYVTLGDVVVISSAVDYDIGHHADARELSDPESMTWFHNQNFDGLSKITLNKDLTDKVYELTKDIKLDSTERTRNFLSKAFDDAEWAIRDPKVLRGTTVTSDNYWKGEYNHLNALKMVEVYECADPFATSEMEDISIGLTLKHLGKLDRYIAIRTCVNNDVFVFGITPERLWGNIDDSKYYSDEDLESTDILPVAMMNEFKVVDTIISAIKEGKLN